MRPVVLKVERRPQALAVPTEADCQRQHQKPSRLCRQRANSEIEERPVTLGLETPTQL